MSQLDKPLLPGTNLFMLGILKSVAKIAGKFIREINTPNQTGFFPSKDMVQNPIKPPGKNVISKASQKSSCHHPNALAASNRQLPRSFMAQPITSWKPALRIQRPVPRWPGYQAERPHHWRHGFQCWFWLSFGWFKKNNRFSVWEEKLVEHFNIPWVKRLLTRLKPYFLGKVR